jgi:hypothetical protein
LIQILYIALEFPPQNNTGTYRSLKFVKYLSLFEIKPIVLTLSERSSNYLFGFNSDTKLLEDVKDIEIHRLSVIEKTKNNNRIFRHLQIFFSVHDNIVDKLEQNIKEEIEKIFSKSNPKAVVITFPPFSCHKLVNWIKKNYETKLIVDLRDAWSAWGNNFFPSYIHYRIIREMERKVFINADSIVTVTDELKEKFISIHGESIRKKIEVIPNGFDFDIKEEKIYNEQLINKNTIRIGYIGSFYFNPVLESESTKPWYKRRFHRLLQYTLKEEDWKYRSPFFFLQTLNVFFQKYPEYKKKIIFEHIGKLPEWLTDMLKEFNLENNFVSHGFKSNSEVKKIASDFDYLLATSEKNLVGPHYCLPSKIFDYLELKKPIIAFVTSGSQYNFLKKSGVSIIFNPDEFNENSIKLFDIFNSNIELEFNTNFLLNYHRRKTCQKLVELINR